MNQFEKWKQGLTLDGEAERRQADEDVAVCNGCPAKQFCYKHQDLNCRDSFRGWGEQNADTKQMP